MYASCLQGKEKKDHYLVRDQQSSVFVPEFKFPPSTMAAGHRVVEIQVPAGREKCGEWLQNMSEEEAADALDLCESTFMYVRQLHSGSQSKEFRVMALDMERIRCEHMTEMGRVKTEIRQKVIEQCRMESQSEIDEMKVRHRAEEHKLSESIEFAKCDMESRVEELNERVEECKKEKRMQIECIKKEYDERLAECQAALDKYRAKEGNKVEEVRRECDEKERALQQIHEKQIDHLQAFVTDIQAKSDSTTNVVAEHLRAQYEGQLSDLKSVHRAQLDEVNARLADNSSETNALKSGTFERIEMLVGSLCGNSARKGEMGEEFVKWVHDRLELGTLSRTGKIQCAGYADFLWEHVPPDSQAIRAIVENKYGEFVNTRRDFSKFREDVREGVEGERINGALYISLTERIAGKPRIAIEIINGVPVLWASRDASDDVGASTLVEIAFSVFTHVWPQLCASGSDDTDTMLKHVCEFVKRQIAEYERLESSIKAFERSGDMIRRETTNLRKTRDSLVTSIYNFQSRHLPCVVLSTVDTSLPDDDTLDSPLGERLLKAIRAYLASMPSKKSRYPKGVGELQSFLSVEDMARITRAGDLFMSAERKIRAEASAAAGRKRKAAVDE